MGIKAKAEIFNNLQTIMGFVCLAAALLMVKSAAGSRLRVIDTDAMRTAELRQTRSVLVTGAVAMTAGLCLVTAGEAHA